MTDYPAKILFEEFLDKGFERILQALQPIEFEDRFVEYKENRKDGVPTDDVNRSLVAKEVSAFANADGGLIVWGVLDKGKGKPRELSPIPNIVGFVQRLTDQANNLLDPPLMGIDTQVVHEENGSGYAATLVPNGSQKPYASLGTCCYMRVGSNAHPMPTRIVRAMMFENARPELLLVVNDAEFVASVETRPMGGQEVDFDRFTCTMNIELYNKGMVTVDRAAIAMPWDDVPMAQWKFKAADGTKVSTVKHREEGSPRWAQPARMFELDSVLYPQTSAAVFQMTLWVRDEHNLAELTANLAYSVYTSHLTERLRLEFPSDLAQKFLLCRAEHEIEIRAAGRKLKAKDSKQEG